MHLAADATQTMHASHDDEYFRLPLPLSVLTTRSPRLSHAIRHTPPRCQLTNSIQNDRGHWRTRKCRELGKTLAISGNHNLNRLSRSTGPQEPSVIEVLEKCQGSFIYSESLSGALDGVV